MTPCTITDCLERGVHDFLACDGSSRLPIEVGTLCPGHYDVRVIEWELHGVTHWKKFHHTEIILPFVCDYPRGCEKRADWIMKYMRGDVFPVIRCHTHRYEFESMGESGGLWTFQTKLDYSLRPKASEAVEEEEEENGTPPEST